MYTYYRTFCYAHPDYSRGWPMMYAAWWPLCAVSRVKRPARGRPQRGEGKCPNVIGGSSCAARVVCLRLAAACIRRWKVEREFFSCLVHVMVSISASGWSVRAAHVDPARGAAQ